MTETHHSDTPIPDPVPARSTGPLGMPWWSWVVIGAVILVIALVQLVPSTPSSSNTPAKTARYQENLAFCKDRATAEVEGSGGLYVVGGNQWIALVNTCLVARDGDRR